MTTTTEIDTHRNAVIARIRTALRQRSGVTWSVTGGRGTTYGWLTIDAPPAWRTWRYRLKPEMLDRPENYEEYNSGERGGHTGPAEREELGRLLELPHVHFQGVSIPASHDYYREYVDRAEGRTPATLGTPYWD